MELLKGRQSSSEAQTCTMYSLLDFKDYYYSYVVPSTGYITKNFRLHFYLPGFILQIPAPQSPDDSTLRGTAEISAIFREAERWGQVEGRICRFLEQDNQNRQHQGADSCLGSAHEKKAMEIAICRRMAKPE